MSEREIAGMKRYDLEPCQHGGFMIIEATAAEDGKWVLASDAAAAVQEALRAGPQPPPPNQGPITMEEKIPEDVLARAREYADEYAGDEWHYANRVGCFARAIMAERERCIAAATSELARLTSEGFADGINAYIATSIRSGV